MYQVEFKMFDFSLRFSPVAFTIFGKDVYWYGLIITVGIILGVVYAFLRAKQSGIKSDHMYDYSIFAIVFGIIGARLYYVLANLDSYKSFKSIISVWNGGLGIYGGIIAAVAAIVITAKVKKHNPLRVLDCAAPGAMLGQAIGRWGNYMNQEAFGCNTTLPWGMRSTVYEQIDGVRLQGTVEYLTSHRSTLINKNPGMTIDPQGYVHPTFLYESLWNILGFILINIFYRKKKFDGEIVFAYLGWYGIGRIFIEGLRTDSLYLGSTGIRVSQLVALICIVLSVFFIIFGRVKAHGAGVTTLYTKTANGKWMMTDAIETYEESENLPEMDENADDEAYDDEDTSALIDDEDEETTEENINEETEKKEDGTDN